MIPCGTARRVNNCDQLYWTLLIGGPKTMTELAAELNWTRSRLGCALQALRRQGCIKLVERGQYKGTQNYCGLWTAIESFGADDAFAVQVDA